MGCTCLSVLGSGLNSRPREFRGPLLSFLVVLLLSAIMVRGKASLAVWPKAPFSGDWFEKKKLEHIAVKLGGNSVLGLGFVHKDINYGQ